MHFSGSKMAFHFHPLAGFYPNATDKWTFIRIVTTVLSNARSVNDEYVSSVLLVKN